MADFDFVPEFLSELFADFSNNAKTRNSGGFVDKDNLIFVNLVDTDMLYGHRNNIEGYAKALEYFVPSLNI